MECVCSCDAVGRDLFRPKGSALRASPEDGSFRCGPFDTYKSELRAAPLVDDHAPGPYALVLEAFSYRLAERVVGDQADKVRSYSPPGQHDQGGGYRPAPLYAEVVEFAFGVDGRVLFYCAEIIDGTLAEAHHVKERMVRRADGRGCAGRVIFRHVRTQSARKWVRLSLGGGLFLSGFSG